MDHNIISVLEDMTQTFEERHAASPARIIMPVDRLPELHAAICAAWCPIGRDPGTLADLHRHVAAGELTIVGLPVTLGESLRLEGAQ